MAKEKKLTIKHLHGEDLKKVSKSSVKLSPLYVQITYNRKTTRLRSFSHSAWSQIEDLEYSRFSNIPLLDHEGREIRLRPLSGLDGFIKMDIEIINELRRLHGKYLSNEFDVSFFSSYKAEKLLTPCDFYANAKLRSYLIDFLEDKNYSKTREFVLMIDPVHIRDFISSLKESNKKLYGDITSTDILNFFYLLPELLLKQRLMIEDKFYFLFDIYNNQKLLTLLAVAKVSGFNPDTFSEILLEQFSGEIYQIFERA